MSRWRGVGVGAALPSLLHCVAPGEVRTLGHSRGVAGDPPTRDVGAMGQEEGKVPRLLKGNLLWTQACDLPRTHVKVVPGTRFVFLCAHAQKVGV